MIKVCAARACYVCGCRGVTLYENLCDRLFGAPGRWNIRRCGDPACGLMWLDPQPLREDLPKAYASYYTHEGNASAGANASPGARVLRGHRFRHAVRDGYLDARYGYRRGSPVAWKKMTGRLMYLAPMRRERADRSVFYLSSTQSGKLLEIGCGDGHSLVRMRQLGWRVEGIDFDPASVSTARRHGLAVRVGELSEQRYEDGEFKAILMRHVIEHVHDPRSVLAECFRILEPFGRLVIFTPNARSWGHRLFGTNWRGLEPPRHLHIFTRQALERLVTEAGLQPLAARSSAGGARRMLLRSLDLARADRGSDSEQHGFDRLTAAVLQYLEWLHTRVGGDSGEELEVIAVKSGAAPKVKQTA